MMILTLLACIGSEPEKRPLDTEVGDSQPVVPCEGITAEVTELDPGDLASMLESKDFHFINVHTPYAGEIPGTDAHIPYNDVDALEEELGSLDAPAVLYCRTGPMSAQATKALVERGYCAIYDLPVGMVGWEQAGYELD